MKKKAFLSFEEDLLHHKEFIRHFEKRIEPILLRAKEKFKLEEQLTVFDKMYDWTVKHLQKFSDSAYQLTVELLANYVEKRKELGEESNTHMEITEILFIQMFIKLHNFFESKSKQDHLQNTILYMLAKKLIGFEVKNNEELMCALFTLMVTQDIIRKTVYFFPEVIICLERVLFYFADQIQERKLKFKAENFDANDKTIDKKQFYTVCRHILEGVDNLDGVSADVILYKTIDKLVGSYMILFGSDPNSDITLANLWNIAQGIKDPVLRAYSESTFNKLKNLIEHTSDKYDMNIIKEKPLIRIKQLTPKFDDSDEENARDYEEEIKKERRTLKKAVAKESKRAMKELAYDSMVLQMEKDNERVAHGEKQKGSFKKFAKFMEEQKLEAKRIKTTQLQHKSRHKVKKMRLAGNKTDPRSGNQAS